jgi:HD-GYP domain-containing protein (c-di-GMP phosphodiesterase class II)
MSDGAQIQVPISLLQVGDVLDADLYNGRALLIPAGTPITERFLYRLSERHITAVTTDSALLKKRLADLDARNVRDAELLEELKEIQPHLLEAASVFNALDPDASSKAQGSVDRFFGCLAQEIEPSASDLRLHAKLLLEQALSMQGKERILLNLCDMKPHETYTCTHSVNVAGVFALFNASELEHAPDAEEQILGAMLHDAGNVRVPVSVLTKPGHLTPQEYAVIKSHTNHGADLLRDVAKLPAIVGEMAHWHHERYDGTGYPDSLTYDRISIGVLCLAVCDSYDALVSKRPFKPRISPSSAVRVLAQSSGTHFSPIMVSKFLRLVGMYPNGSYVELTDGRLGLVIQQTKALLRPIVLEVGTCDYGITEDGKEVDLSETMTIGIKRCLASEIIA